MAHGDEIREALRKAYVYDRLELSTAAEKASISLSTARRWKAEAEQSGDDWERARTAARLAGEGRQSAAEMILNDYLMLHQACIENVKADTTIDPLKKAEVLSRLADSFNKMMAAVSRASPELNQLAIATDVIQRLAAFVQRSKPSSEQRAWLKDILGDFAAELSRIYN